MSRSESTLRRVDVAVQAALARYAFQSGDGWSSWARAWLDGSDRSEDSARRARLMAGQHRWCAGRRNSPASNQIDCAERAAAAAERASCRYGSDEWIHHLCRQSERAAGRYDHGDTREFPDPEQGFHIATTAATADWPTGLRDPDCTYD